MGARTADRSRQRFRRWSRRAFHAASALAVFATTPVLAEQCVQSHERTSFDVRVLQSRLMVAALSCGAHAEYNAFVRKYQPSLRIHGQTLNRFFERQYGRRSRALLDDYVTALANESSAISNTDRAAYCGQSQSIFSVLQQRQDDRLETFQLSALAGSSSLGPNVCQTASRDDVIRLRKPAQMRTPSLVEDRPLRFDFSRN